MSFDVAAELKIQIAKEDDGNRRNILMLLLGVLEANIEGMNRLSRKLDDLRNDEQSLRTAVLNGHEARHHVHHDWVEERMNSSCAEACEWAESKRLEEIDDKKSAKETEKADHRAVRNSVIQQVIAIALSLAMGGAAAVIAMNHWFIPK